jgi:hypothetical protein
MIVITSNHCQWMKFDKFLKDRADTDSFFYLVGTGFDSQPMNGLSRGCVDVLSPCNVGLSTADRQASHLSSYVLTSHYSVRVTIGFLETVEPTSVHFGLPFVSPSCGLFIFVFHLTVPFMQLKINYLMMTRI